MRVLIFVITILLAVICVYSIYEVKRHAAVQKNIMTWYEPATKQLKSKIDKLCTSLAAHQSQEVIHQNFREARLAYKEIEVLAEYFNPYTVQLINGRGDDTTGGKEGRAFQVLEHLIYPELQAADTQVAYVEVRKLAAAVNSLCQTESRPAPTDAELFDAMRLELIRIMSLGLSGFDSPEADHSIKEAAAALDGVKQVWQLYDDRVEIYNPALEKYTTELLTAAEKQLAQGEWNNFNRQAFITDYINQLSVNLKLSREALEIPYDNEPFILDPAASNVFARNAVHPLYVSPDASQDSAGSHDDPLYDINGQQFRASYMYMLLQQNGALNTVAESTR